jgi:hypothetical protein
MHHAHLMKKYLIILFLLVSYPAFAQTITGVSGTVSNGQSITISGSDFGSGPIVLLFDDFEGGVNGNQLSLDSAPLGTWSHIQTADHTSYSTANTVSGGLAARFDSYDYPVNQHPNIYVNAPVAFNTLYISWWGLIPAGDIFPGCGYGGCNWKTIWVCDIGGSVNQGDVSVAANGTSAWSIFGNSYPYEYSAYLHDPWDSDNNVNLPNGTWHRFQLYIKGRTDNTGEERIWLTTTAGNTRLVKNRNRQTLEAGDENMRQRFYVNGYVRDTPNSHPTFDDVYIAYGENAQARVEIGNADTYTGCSSLAMCTPTSWGVSSIVCTVRQGNIPEGNAWVYVTDTNGNRSSGYPVTIGGGGGGDSSPPYTSGHYPAKGTTGFYKDSNIVLHLQDSGDGVDQSSIVVTVNGQTVSPNITGTQSDYTLTYDPPNPLAGEVVVRINAQDLHNPPNVMSQDTYTFTVGTVTVVE